MKFVFLLFRIGLAFLTLLQLPARAEDALWAKVSANALAAKQLAAGDIEMLVTAFNAGNPVGPRHFQSHLSHWVNGKPVYTMIEVDSLPGTSKGKGRSSAEMMNAIVEMADSLLDPGSKMARTDGQQLDGKTWTVFRQEDTGVGRKMASKIWVDTDTACVHQIEADLHIALYGDGHLKTSYAADAQGRCLPRLLEADIDFITPFKGGKMKLKQTSSNWVERPAATAQN